jgi:predicted TIM-barrel fold metal-dependent hydrolase
VTGRGDLPLPPRAGPIVDADGHVVEPASAWAALPDRYRPRISADGAGDEHVVVGDTEVLAMPPGTFTRPRGSDPRARLRDMDGEGIDQAVLYPTIGLSCSLVEDPAAAVALAAASNDWLAGNCSIDPRRLFGAATLPLQDPVAAARELRRAVSELGLVSAFVRTNPRLGRSLADRAYDVVWEAAEELNVPIGIHEGSSVSVPTLGSERPRNPLILHAVSHPFEAMLACAELIAFGTLERHPGLRLLFLGSSGGWVPFWLGRLDAQAESFGGFCPDMARRPSEYFARQCAVSFDVDERTLPALVPFVGERRVVWGSDSPHHDATFPGAVAAIRSTVAPCATAAQVHVLGLNARQLYGLPTRRTGLPGLLDDYFTAVTAQEIDLVRVLFAPDAIFESGGIRLQGLDAICGYYLSKTFTYEDFRPAPRTPTFEDNRIEVDIDVHLSGTESSVHDVFETDGTRITALRVSGFEEALRGATR